MRWELVGIVVLIGLGIGLLVFQQNEPDLKPAGTGDESKVTIAPIGLDGLEKELQSHKGKVVLVDFWATWCGPCRAEFPKFVAIQERYTDRGLVCISVALERDLDNGFDSALAFLRKHKSTSRNFVWIERSTRGADGLEAIFGYPGGIPYAALFAKTGTRIPPADDSHFSNRELVDRIEAELAK